MTKAKQAEEVTEKKICPNCGAELYAIEGGYACYACGARFGVSRAGNIFPSYVPGFRPAA